MASQPETESARWAEASQPAPIFNPNGSKGQKFRVQALLCRKATGKAATSIIRETRWLSAATAEEALARRDQFIQEYLHVERRPRAAISAPEGVQHSARERQPKREAAPVDLRMVKQKSGPINPKAGPGRGHIYEPARAISDQVRELPLLPPADAEEATNWLKRVQIYEKWKTVRMQQLEQQVEALLIENAQQSTTIRALRQRVCDLLMPCRVCVH